MQGADEYARLFGREQHGRLYLYPSEHARGATFQIWLLPTNELVQGGCPWDILDAVEVYGVLGGNPGWSEYYGWIHRGPWVEDFEQLVQRRKAEKDAQAAENLRAAQDAEHVRQERVRQLLANYP